MIVCVCRRVSDHQIRRAAGGGAVSLECLQRALGVATQCGRCADCAESVLREAHASTPITLHRGLREQHAGSSA